YRKHYSLPADAKDKHVFIDFDGVMANSDVWINGHLLGHRPYGYSAFRYDLTPHLQEQNVIAVRCNNSQQPASRWYAGAGIYRHVNVLISDPVHCDHWSSFITTTHVAPDAATVHVRSVVVNESDRRRQIFISAKLFDPDRYASSAVSQQQTVEPGTSAVFETDVKVDNPKHWDIDSPNLYRAHISVAEDRTV